MANGSVSPDFCALSVLSDYTDSFHSQRGVRHLHVRIQRGSGGPDPHPEKNTKTIGFLSNTGLDPLKNYKATKPAFNVAPMAFRWRADEGPLIVVSCILPQSTKKTKKKIKV